MALQERIAFYDEQGMIKPHDYKTSLVRKKKNVDFASKYFISR